VPGSRHTRFNPCLTRWLRFTIRTQTAGVIPLSPMKTKFIPLLVSLLSVAVMSPSSNAAVNAGPEAHSSETMKQKRGGEGVRRRGHESFEDTLRRGRGRDDGRRHR
jgi:hypothetical protein